MSAFPISRGEQMAAIKDGIGIRRIGPEEAQGLLLLNRRNRRLFPSSVLVYAKDMEGGLWKDTGTNAITIWEDTETGECTLVDGQHRLHAVIESGTTQKFQIVHRASCEISLQDLYGAIDQGRIRTFIDWMHVEEFAAGGRSEAERHLSAATSAIIVLEVQIRGLLDGTGTRSMPRLSTLQKTELLHRYETDIRWAAALRMRQTKGNRRPLPVGVMAAAIACNRIAPEQATAFFTRIAIGADIHEGTAEFSLRDIWLRGGDPRRTKQAHEAHLYWYGVAINGWNHCCAGDRVDFLRSLDIPRCTVRKPTK